MYVTERKIFVGIYIRLLTIGVCDAPQGEAMRAMSLILIIYKEARTCVSREKGYAS